MREGPLRAVDKQIVWLAALRLHEPRPIPLEDGLRPLVVGVDSVHRGEIKVFSRSTVTGLENRLLVARQIDDGAEARPETPGLLVEACIYVPAVDVDRPPQVIGDALGQPDPVDVPANPGDEGQPRQRLEAVLDIRAELVS